MAWTQIAVSGTGCPITHSLVKEFAYFEIDNVRLKNDRENAFVKNCVKIGNAKETPVIQEETILDMFEIKGYVPRDVQLGPFGIGGM